MHFGEIVDRVSFATDDLRAALAQSFCKSPLDSAQKRGKFFLWNLIRWSGWMDFRPVQRFIDVDVAKAGQELLIEQCELDRYPSPSQPSLQRFDISRVLTDPLGTERHCIDERLNILGWR